MYTLKHAGYCGMKDYSETFDTLQEARAQAAFMLRDYRENYPVTTVRKGEEWEIMENESCVMVPDDCGILWITHVFFECRECGSNYENEEDARGCCQEIEDETY